MRKAEGIAGIRERRKEEKMQQITESTELKYDDGRGAAWGRHLKRD